MRHFLKSLKIIQEVPNKDRIKKLGRGFITAKRLNPYNPLSYLTIIVIFIIGVVMFGFVGVWRELGEGNPFKWR